MEQNYLDLFLQGGFIIIILLFLSIISLAIILERLIFISRFKTGFMKLCRGEVNLMTLSKDLSLFAEMFKEVFTSDVKEKLDLVKAYEHVEEILKRRTHMLIFIVQLAPLLGILGTVLGLSDAFLSMSQLGGAEKFQFLAMGVGKALSTTIAGLIIAAYTMSGHYLIKYFSANVMKIVDTELPRFINKTGTKNES